MSSPGVALSGPVGSPITGSGYGSTGLSSGAQGVIGGLGAGVLSALGNAFGPPTPGTSTTNGTTSGTSTPTYSSAVLPLYNQLLSSYMQQANGGTADAAINSYGSQGQQQINATNQGGVNSLNTILAQRGQQYSPSGTTSLVQQELNRQNQQVNLNNSLPQMRYQANQQSLSNAGNFFASLPHGTSTTGTNNSTTTTTPPQQSWISGLLGGVAQALPAALAMF